MVDISNSRSLAHFQARAGISTIIMFPLYRQAAQVATDLEPVGGKFQVQVGPRTEEAQLFESRELRANPSKQKPRILFIANANYFEAQVWGPLCMADVEYFLVGCPGMPLVSDAPFKSLKDLGTVNPS